MGLKKKKTKKIVAFSAFFFIFLVSTFLFNVHPADAGIFSFITDTAAQGFYYVINVILYSVFLFVSFPVSWAAMLFGLTVDPVAVNTMFAMPAIYTLWQMVRDFFNLFFILTLLFIAFATIFQISSFNYKKALGKLLLMALLVNFSFPIARFVIDVANVPMYFFMESMFENPSTAKAKDIAEVAFSTSGMQKLILPGVNGYGDVKGEDGLTLQLLVGIIFMFLFGVSLFVLAILFLVRSLMLVVLIIFSSVGFAGMVIPGFRSFATKWWDNLLKYAFFGPAAMLMLLVAAKFLREFSGPGGIGSRDSMAAANSGLALENPVTYLASMVAVMAPIILIWISITIGQTMGIHAADGITKNAQKFSKWAGRKGARAGLAIGTLGAAPYAMSRGKEIGKGAQEGWKSFKKTGTFAGVAVPGAKPFTTEAKERREARYAGFFKGGRKGVLDAEKELARKRTYEKADEMKKGNTSNSDLRTKIGAGNRKADGSFKDPIEAAAAAMVLADRKALAGADEFVNALQALGDNTKEISTLIEKAGGDALKLDANQYEKAMSSFNIASLQGTGENELLKKSLDGKLHKEGKAKVIVDYQVSKRAPGTSESDAYLTAYDNVLGKKGASDIVKQSDIFDDKHFMTYAENRATANPRWAQAVMDEIVKSPSNAQHEGKWAGVILKSTPVPPKERVIATDTNIAAAKQARDAEQQNKTT